MALYKISWVESRTVTGTFRAATEAEALRVGSSLAFQHDDERIARDTATAPTVTAVTALGRVTAHGEVIPL